MVLPDSAQDVNDFVLRARGLRLKGRSVSYLPTLSQLSAYAYLSTDVVVCWYRLCSPPMCLRVSR
eukprot:905738-Rhodomonas_salina.1